ncbi:MAG: sigma-54 dependent transcriptional regulator [Candidatus Aminicenantes bacterium]|nr:sigma-54 dependent transcriptional regulator [Candidatus Aminicenantes bacterium]
MNDNALIWIIDDAAAIRELLSFIVTEAGYEIDAFSSGEEVLAHSGHAPDAVLLDLMMPGVDGVAVLKELRRRFPTLPVIMITADNDIQRAVEVTKLGAYDYLVKPVDKERLLTTLARALSHGTLEKEVVRLKGELSDRYHLRNIVGSSAAMRKVYDQVEKVLESEITVYIAGESGTGKELVAKAIHQNSDRSGGPFITVNSGSLPPDLLESHLFGHVKGAFTGAVNQKKGLFEAADRGSIFFDEVSSINLETQAKLLRVMQEREFMRLGGTKTIKVDVRIIAATNTDLEELIHQKAFRKDLFYRLNVIKIELPPLRERKDDIPLLVKHFIGVYGRENNKEIEGVSVDVLELLMNYDWPGNIRELENLIERAAVLSRSKLITRDNLPPFLISSREEAAGALTFASEEMTLHEQLQEYQKKVILATLKKTKGVQNKAAQILGLKPTTLNEMIKRLKIDIRQIS